MSAEAWAAWVAVALVVVSALLYAERRLTSVERDLVWIKKALDQIGKHLEPDAAFWKTE